MSDDNLVKTCPYCKGSGKDDSGRVCDECNGSGKIHKHDNISVPDGFWDCIKSISNIFKK